MSKKILIPIIIVVLIIAAGIGLIIFLRTTQKETKCAKEGEFNSGGKLTYYYDCCSGLKKFDVCPSCPPDKSYLCFNPSKGTPVCKSIGTESEGLYYSESGDLLMHGKCSE